MVVLLTSHCRASKIKMEKSQLENAKRLCIKLKRDLTHYEETLRGNERFPPDQLSLYRLACNEVTYVFKSLGDKISYYYYTQKLKRRIAEIVGWDTRRKNKKKK